MKIPEPEKNNPWAKRIKPDDVPDDNPPAEEVPSEEEEEELSDEELEEQRLEKQKVLHRKVLIGVVAIALIASLFFYIHSVKISGRPAETIGKIIVSELKETTVPFPGERKKADKIKLYEPQITYEYKVKGKKYRGNEISTGSYSSNNKSRVEEILARYPKDAFVKVYYNRDNPKEAVLEPQKTYKRKKQKKSWEKTKFQR